MRRPRNRSSEGRGAWCAMSKIQEEIGSQELRAGIHERNLVSQREAGFLVPVLREFERQDKMRSGGRRNQLTLRNCRISFAAQSQGRKRQFDAELRLKAAFARVEVIESLKIAIRPTVKDCSGSPH